MLPHLLVTEYASHGASDEGRVPGGDHGGSDDHCLLRRVDTVRFARPHHTVRRHGGAPGHRRRARPSRQEQHLLQPRHIRGSQHTGTKPNKI